MLHTARAYRGMVTAPHHLAAQAGLRVLQENGNAIEAMVAAAAAISVVYPHINSLTRNIPLRCSGPSLPGRPCQPAIGIAASGGRRRRTGRAFTCRAPGQR